MAIAPSRLWLRRAVRASTAPIPNKTLYGVNTFNPPYLAAHNNVITTASSIGTQVIRTGITWSNMQTTVGGTIDWSQPDSIYAKCNAAGIKVIFVIETTPTAYNLQPYGYFATLPPKNPSLNIGDPTLAIPPVTDATYFPQFIADHVAWAKQVVQRYPLALFEWWNEWSTASGYWNENDDSSAKPTISAFIQAYMAVYAGVKSVAPTCTMAVGGMTHPVHWYGANGTPAITVLPMMTGTSGFQTDAWSLHPYVSDATPTSQNTINQNPDTPSSSTNAYNVFRDIEKFQAVMIANGQGGKPLWITEWGTYSAADVGSETIKAGYVGSSLARIRDRLSVGKLGPGKAGVSIATFYPLLNLSFAPTDTGLAGPSGNGPYTVYQSGSAFQAFTAGLPAYTGNGV